MRELLELLRPGGRFEKGKGENAAVVHRDERSSERLVVVVVVVFFSVSATTTNVVGDETETLTNIGNKGDDVNGEQLDSSGGSSSE